MIIVSTTRARIIRTIKTIGKLFFPSFCVSCGKECFEERWLCDPCQESLMPFPHTICPLCHSRTVGGRLENSCVAKTGLTRFFCAYPLRQKSLQALIYSYKYRRGATLHGHLSRLLMDWIANNRLLDIFENTQEFIVVPIPLHKERMRQRGFNQAALIARDIADSYAFPYASPLIRLKPTPSQLVARSKEAREKNMENAFAVKDKNKVAGKRIVLVDDVYTTGATMKHAALALRKAGAKEVWGVTIAKG